MKPNKLFEIMQTSDSDLLIYATRLLIFRYVNEINYRELCDFVIVFLMT